MLWSTLRKKYMDQGPSCIKDEQVWEELVHNILTKVEKIDPITAEHYLVMKYVRQYYLEKKRAPSVKEICTLTEFSMDKFLGLFPDWPHTLFNIDRIVCIVLGLPCWNIKNLE